ncbi:MAG: PDZ domain-containing protein [Deltaproteobacteria bacterium]|nr:PDZ domain-containing protein [Deltaproteobacteria bacterium]
MKTRTPVHWLFVAALLFVGVPPLTVQGAQPEVMPSTEGSEEIPPGQRIGAPQVLEISPQPVEPDPVANNPLPETTAPVSPARSAESRDPPTNEQAGRKIDPFPQAGANSPSGANGPRATGQRNYLGVLYATAEEGPVGVKVLDVVPGSPAERAGFSGANRPTEGRSNLIKAAIVVLAMSPAGPFAIPLAIVHDMYMTKQTPGDLIVAVNDQAVRNAQEFSDMMRRYKPQETVSFSILRSGKAMKLSVKLEEEPA